MYWPSFNGGGAAGDEQHRAFINTYLSLAACTVVTFAMSALYDAKGKFTMVITHLTSGSRGVGERTCGGRPLTLWYRGTCRYPAWYLCDLIFCDYKMYNDLWKWNCLQRLICSNLHQSIIVECFQTKNLWNSWHCSESKMCNGRINNALFFL